MSNDRHRAALLRLVALIFAVAALGFPCTVRAQNALAYQDGLLALAEVEGSELVLRWRFLRPSSAPLDTAIAEVNGRPVGLPQIRPYPQSGDLTVLTFLLDTSDPARAEEIAANNATLLGLLTRLKPYHRAGIVTYGADASILVASSDKAEDLINAVLDLAPDGDKVNRDEALIKAIAALGSLPATRRAIFVFSDGHTDSTGHVDAVVKLAADNGVTVTFVMVNAAGLRSIDPDSLAAIAAGSGGDVITPDDLAAFIADPFAILDSGAEVVFPLAGAYRLPWESAPNATVRMTYGAKALELKVPVELPPASPQQMVDYAAGSPAVLGGGAAVLALVLIGAVATVRRKPRAAKTPPPLPKAPPQALIELPAGQQPYAVDRPIVCIGRDPENDLVIADGSVSRRHAVLTRTDTGGFQIDNAGSTNGVMVNERPVERAILADGDMIRLGNVSVRFRVGAPAAAGN